MIKGFTIVIDIGKTLSKVSLWTPEGVLVEKRSRPNDRVRGQGYLALDVGGIEAWLVEVLSQLAKLAPVAGIVPVAHGAAIAVVREGRLHMPPMDYENPLPANERLRYDAQRDPFALTGSPALPDGLNLGAQLHLLDLLDPTALRPGATLLPWPQYWAWRLSGVVAAEVSSLGCHSDLWCPGEARPSTLAVQRGWADLLAPIRRAGDCLGTITSEWSHRTGLSPGVNVYCGLHDSNAALLAARGFPEIASGEATVLSTGTWFVAMRTPSTAFDVGTLPEHRDCLVNIDVYGQQIPSARFMGGREIETLTGIDTRRIDIRPDQPKIVAALTAALDSGARLLPSFVGKCGPYPRARGRWIRMPAEDASRRAIVSLYAALVADVSLDLIGARDRLLIEGRFASAEVFVRSLARLRPETAVFVAHEENDVSYGALRLLDPQLSPKTHLTRVAPLDTDLHALQQDWRAEAERMELAA